MRLWPFEFESYHHNQLDLRIPHEPHHNQPRSNYCDDPFLRNDFSYHPPNPLIENHGFNQEPPLKYESMMSIMKEYMNMQQFFLEHRKEFKKLK